MELQIDPASPVPLYLQIVEQVRRLIAIGALTPGDRLPAVRDLAVRARVNRNTAARAVRELEAAGLVRTRVGQGTFVAEREDRLDPGVRDREMDEAIDGLLIRAHGLDVPLEELGWRVNRRIEVFRRVRRDAGAESGEER